MLRIFIFVTFPLKDNFYLRIYYVKMVFNVLKFKPALHLINLNILEFNIFLDPSRILMFDLIIFLVFRTKITFASLVYTKRKIMINDKKHFW